MRPFLVGLAAGLAVAFAVTVIAGATATTPPERKIGGALCQPQVSSGVICRWPNKPWAVGVTPYVVFAWRRHVVQYAHSNN